MTGAYLPTLMWRRSVPEEQDAIVEALRHSDRPLTHPELQKATTKHHIGHDGMENALAHLIHQNRVVMEPHEKFGPAYPVYRIKEN